MNSTITIAELIQSRLDYHLESDRCIPYGTHWDTQDTDDTNESEVYVYAPTEEKDEIPYVIEKVNEILGLPEDYKPDAEDPDLGHPLEIRLAFIVTICHNTGDGKAFV